MERFTKGLDTLFYAVMFAIGFAIGLHSCSKAHGATYGNDTAAIAPVIATAQQAATADTTKTEK
ncbi:MAG: hypothetical protein HGA87_00780 [Desulfobulbaceae bacterium]|nr:hypothetical protein [Desulfobulbaceae bacterium]